MSKIKEIIFATKNKNKVYEIKKELKNTSIEVIPLSELNFDKEIVEDGETFEENALLKAQTIFQEFGKPVIAEDSGIVIEALNGLPGVYSARWAGVGATDDQLIDKTLSEMQKIPEEKRNAYYKAVIVLYLNENEYYSFEGRCFGKIAQERIGEGGFGYDPIFYVEELGKTTAQLTTEEKNKISHRGKALRKFLRKINDLQKTP